MLYNDFECFHTLSSIVIGGIFVSQEIEIYEGIINLVYILASGIFLLVLLGLLDKTT